MMAASTPSTIDNTKPRIPLTGYLYTPPEHTADSFSYPEEENEDQQVIEGWRIAVSAKAAPQAVVPLVHTPPASPHEIALPSITSVLDYPSRDAPLFPQQASSDRAHSPQPLFDRHRTQSPTPVQSIEVAKPRHTLEQPPNNPQPRHKIFPFNLGIKTQEQALAYYKKVNGEGRRMGRQLPTPKRSPDSHLEREDVRQLDSLIRSAGVTKPRSAAPRIPSKPKAVIATSPVKATPHKRRTPKARVASTFIDSAFSNREPSTKHKRAPPSKKVEGDNVSWTELTDYAPPASDLDHNPKSLKVTWHGHALPLHDDPDQSELHEQEIIVASTLRLSCSVYLTNKRKIFQARLQALKDGKNFTKTAAQSACKIDVNKASQLWEAFDRVGWFNPEWYAKYLA